MSVAPFPIQVLRDSKWSVIQTDELLPGDVVSLGICLLLYKAVFHTF
jgi:magnesium-transporting ATPase (P-type)